MVCSWCTLAAWPGRKGDYVLQQLFASLYEDCQWQQQWSQALVRLVMQDTPANQQVLQQWVNKWYAMMVPAISAFAPLFDQCSESPGAGTGAEVVAQLCAALEEYLCLAGLECLCPQQVERARVSGQHS